MESLGIVGVEELDGVTKGVVLLIDVTWMIATIDPTIIGILRPYRSAMNGPTRSRPGRQRKREKR